MKNLGHIRVALWRVPPFRGAATGRLHHQSLGAQARGVIDAIVSIKTFGNATLRGIFFADVFFVKRNKASRNFERFKMNSALGIPKLGFMQVQSRTYTNFLASSFPLIPCRVILEESFASRAAKPTLPTQYFGRRSAEPAGAWSNW